MFLKYLLIENEDGLIRRIDFRLGMNLIVDDTEGKTSDSGNNVGKTTLLNLIDYCLGGKAESIYRSHDRSVNKEVKTFLEETNVEVELCLVDSLVIEKCRQVVIRRNFLSRKYAVRKINGRQYQDKDFDYALEMAILELETKVPSYRQLISHSLRIDDQRLSQPLLTFPTSYGSKIEYEALHLYMLGASREEVVNKVSLSQKNTEEDNYRKRLEKDAKGNLSLLRTQQDNIGKELQKIEVQKEALKLNPDFEKDLNRLAFLKNRLSRLGMEQNALQLRRSLVLEASREMKSMYSRVDKEQVESIYRQASAFNEKLHHTFSELLAFHNGMLGRRADFIESELPQLDSDLDKISGELAALRKEELTLQNKLNLSVTFETIDEIMTKQGTLNREYGEQGRSIRLLEGVADSMRDSSDKIDDINRVLQAQEWQKVVQDQVDKFNVHFTEISQKLYKTDYHLYFEIGTYKYKPCYQFKIDAADSYGSGKKQGEVCCFDLAYIKFADEEGILCLHFTLYDKLELVHGNQLGTIVSVTESMPNVQNVVAILKDKLPEGLDIDKYVVQTLSESKRLFNMEESTWYKVRHPEQKK